uniref:Putative rep protein n=1 Tax=uncultured virus TaxID=340016 RepID=A0A1D8MK55_9VIRU|nr:putative rep protein [uncultured virus]
MQNEQKAQPRRRNFQGSDDEESEDEYKVHGEGESKRFRFNARKCFLTYAKCPIPPESFLDLFPLAHRVKTCFAKQELHEDKTPHLHAFVSFTRKLDLSNPGCFDIPLQPGDDDRDVHGQLRVRHHPNIKRVAGIDNTVRRYEYLCKDGTPPTVLRGEERFLHPFSKNFTREFGDRVNWLEYLRSVAQPRPVWPILGPALTGPGGEQLPRIEFQDPREAGKKRHAWIYGPPDAGKTKWLEENVYCWRNYKIADNLYPYDQYYGDASIIIYDDVKPVASHLLSASNSSKYPRPVPGKTRYFRHTFPAGLATWIVVCTNFSIQSTFADEEPETIEALKARFIEIKIRRPADPNSQPQVIDD